MILQWLFPPKCVLCQALLESQETDLGHHCRVHVPEVIKGKFKLSFIARWTAVWYYNEDVRASILRLKFSGRRSYAKAYGRMLAMKLQEERMDDFDILTWVPVSWQRRFTRGYDQVELLAKATAAELGIHTCKTLKKVRNTPPQSGFRDAARRRANVLNAYRVVSPVRDKRILLLDDVLTTGATASECARTLLTAGAKEVCFASVAVASHDQK